MGNATSSAAALADLRVVILGASFAGLAAAHAAHTAGFSVTVVEPRDRFFHVIGAPRCVVEDGFETAVHVGYDRTLPASARLTRVRGYAQSVNTASKTVTLTMLDSSDAAGGNRAKNLGSGAGGPVTLSYDLLVIATGTAAWHKSGPALTSSVAAMQADAALRAAVLAARQVVVVGGGAVGIETAGEIKTDHPDKVVTLIHSGAHLMSSDAAGKLPASFYGLLLKGLAAKGVTVRLGERAAGHGADGPEAATAAGLTVVRQGVYAGRDTLKSAGSGNHLVTCDLQLWMTGSGAPNTAWCKTDATLAAACTPAGFLRVTPTWQVEGCVDREEPGARGCGQHGHAGPRGVDISGGGQHCPPRFWPPFHTSETPRTHHAAGYNRDRHSGTQRWGGLFVRRSVRRRRYVVSEGSGYVRAQNQLGAGIRRRGDKGSKCCGTGRRGASRKVASSTGVFWEGARRLPTAPYIYQLMVVVERWLVRYSSGHTAIFVIAFLNVAKR